LQLLDNAIASLLVDAPELAEEAKLLAGEIRFAQSIEQTSQLTNKAKKLSYRISFVAEDQSEIRSALLKLLRLVIDNISELVLDDKWVHGQISVVTELIGQQPLNLRQLDTVESRLRDLIVKQSALKQNLSEAQERLKAMLAMFVDRLADFSESTIEYQEKVEKCAERITQAESISELSDVLDDVMRETRDIQINALRSHNDLSAMRLRVDESDREINRLQSELAQASELVRHDPLTGALNRKGMNEAVEREVARAKRQGGPLSMAMLDIDNFKLLNDRLGHDAGDAALVHLAKVIRETIRPQDTSARFGGEEFVILLPNTGLNDGATAMTRVQRELTRKYFLHDDEKILITFSCGVAELASDETPEDCLKRADGAMYLAKRTGKNRVITA
jgi:diguanylate cyclase